MRGGTIDNATYGMRAEESLVFLRHGVKVSNAGEYGIGVYGEDPLNSMLTLGDLGCATINDANAGITGMGTTLNIDAYIHADNSGTGISSSTPFIQFNDLSNHNYDYIDMCYDVNASVLPTTVHAKGIFWDEVSGSGTSPNPTMVQAYSTSGFYPNNPSGWSCGSSTNNIPVDIADHSTCVPAAVCDCFLGSSPSGNGSFNGVANKMDDGQQTSASIPNKSLDFDPFVSSGEACAQLLLGEYVTANLAFMANDNPATRRTFVPIASVKLVREGEQYIGYSTTGKRLELDEESIHRIIVAKVLTKIPMEGQQGEDIFNQYFKWLENESTNPSLLAFPNPAQDQITLKLSGENTNFNYQMVNELGDVVSTGSLGSGSNQIEVSKLASGVYAIVLSDLSGKTIKSEKLIIQH